MTNNAASGGFAGFFYPVLPKPVGLSRSIAIVPSTRPLLLFEGNVAHSSGRCPGTWDLSPWPLHVRCPGDVVPAATACTSTTAYPNWY